MTDDIGARTVYIYTTYAAEILPSRDSVNKSRKREMWLVTYNNAIAS
jgi:hypothetical protein